MSDIVCACPACPAKFKVDGKFAGKKARCPKCATVIDVPVEGVLITDEAEAAPAGAPIAVSTEAFPALNKSSAAVADSGPAGLWGPAPTAADSADQPGHSSSGGFDLQLNSSPKNSATKSNPSQPTSPAKFKSNSSTSNKKAAAANSAQQPMSPKQAQEAQKRFFILCAVVGVLLVAVVAVGILLVILKSQSPGKPKAPPAKTSSSKSGSSKSTKTKTPPKKTTSKR